MHIALFLLITAHASDTCKVLVIEGGGVHGSIEAGMLKAMVELLPSEEIDWDFISGVSAGSMNASMISRFEKGDEKNMVNHVLNYWQTIQGNQSMYNQWPYPSWYIAQFEGGLYDPTPSRTKLENAYKGLPIVRKVTIGATNYQNGHFETWDESTPEEDFISAIMASSSMPIYFPNYVVNGQYYADGGVIKQFDVMSPVQRCLEQTGGDQTSIIVDILMASQVTVDSYNVSQLTTSTVNNIAKGIKFSNLNLDEIYQMMATYPDVSIRYLLMPEQSLPNAFNFDPKVVASDIELGYSIGQNIVGNDIRFPEYAKMFEEKHHLNFLQVYPME